MNERILQKFSLALSCALLILLVYKVIVYGVHDTVSSITFGEWVVILLLSSISGRADSGK